MPLERESPSPTATPSTAAPIPSDGVRAVLGQPAGESSGRISLAITRERQGRRGGGRLSPAAVRTGRVGTAGAGARR